MVLPGLAMALVMSISVFLTVQQSGAGTNAAGHDRYWVAIAGAITGVVVGLGLRRRRAPGRRLAVPGAIQPGVTFPPDDRVLQV